LVLALAAASRVRSRPGSGRQFGRHPLGVEDPDAVTEQCAEVPEVVGDHGGGAGEAGDLCEVVVVDPQG
jgi:hypothetical protein